jgi:nucleoside-diphosphate-sugar epimerase
MKKSVLVMGGSYFIGKKIVDELIEKRYSVYTLNRGTKPIHNSKIHNIKCDRNDENEMKKVLYDIKFDIVIDVCGLNKKHVEILYNAINVGAVKKFVFISSSAVYDVEECNIPYLETDKLKENKYWTFYGQNKIEAESFLVDKFKNTSTNLIILRPPYVYGENNYAQRESFIFDHIYNNKPIIIPNKGEKKLQFIYAADLANIILKLLSIQLPSVTTFNVGNKNAVTIREWIYCCEEATNKKAIIVEYDYEKYKTNVRHFFPFFDYDNVLDVKKINEVYDVETDFIQGLKNCYLWYCENKDNIIFKEDIAKNEQAILNKQAQL